MDTLRSLIKQVLEGYAIPGANFISSLTVSDDGNTFSVVDVARDYEGKRFVATSIHVRLVVDKVVIEHDDNDKPVVDALVQAGIPREQIILAYAGEPVPETFPPTL